MAVDDVRASALNPSQTASRGIVWLLLPDDPAVSAAPPPTKHIDATIGYRVVPTINHAPAAVRLDDSESGYARVHRGR